MLQPKRTKYRKQMKGRNYGVATRGNKVSFGEFGLKALGYARITARQIEAARRAVNRYIKRGGKVWIRLFPDKPITKKPIEVRMGKVMFEIEGVTPEIAREAFRLAASKLPIKTEFVERVVK
jgi:large subunit ribosomal protein L16